MRLPAIACEANTTLVKFAKQNQQMLVLLLIEVLLKQMVKQTVKQMVV
jgi:hypothetical protein